MSVMQQPMMGALDLKSAVMSTLTYEIAAPPEEIGSQSGYILEKVQQAYRISDAPAIAAYFARYPAAPVLLLDARPEILRVFGPDAMPRLDLVTFSAYEPAHLYVVIPTLLSPAEAHAKVGELDETWWLDNIQRAGVDITANVEFH